MNRTRSKIVSLLLGSVLLLSAAACSTADTSVQAEKSKKDEEQAAVIQEPFKELQQAADEYLKGTDFKTMTVAEVYETAVLKGDPDYFVLDVRSAAAFAAGNIPGSVNIPYAVSSKPKYLNNLPKDKNIIVVCFSGHTASQTAASLNLLGFNAIPMVNGIGGWTSDPNLGVPIPDAALEHGVTATPAAAGTFEYPVLDIEKAASVEDLVYEQTERYLASGKPPVLSAGEVKEKVLAVKDSSFYLVDVRSPDDYKKGHIQGAVNIPANEIADLEQLKKLPADKKVLLIGYDGHEASQAARILNLLGYDTYAMKDGMRVWTSDPEINGIAPISAEKIAEYPLEELNVDLEQDQGAASCG
ncbi:rhodanese-like domain-containing protein [Bacillus marinisedimentorum]|uniref:rhodanese-like domain-containing protein n=1 Tax=Bacillus marinisedimentorum TaxID=1821260 RepID=UPI0008725CBD|nr:rhodanese-like domain-containing protein [Bacillus marinisedimentorum]